MFKHRFKWTKNIVRNLTKLETMISNQNQNIVFEAFIKESSICCNYKLLIANSSPTLTASSPTLTASSLQGHGVGWNWFQSCAMMQTRAWQCKMEFQPSLLKDFLFCTNSYFTSTNPARLSHFPYCAWPMMSMNDISLIVLDQWCPVSCLYCDPNISTSLVCP